MHFKNNNTDEKMNNWEVGDATCKWVDRVRDKQEIKDIKGETKHS